MGTPGKVATLPSGKRGVRSGGRAAAFNAGGACNSCCVDKFYYTACQITFSGCDFQSPTSEYLGQHAVGTSVVIDGTTVILPASSTGWTQYFNNGATSSAKVIKYYRIVALADAPAEGADSCSDFAVANPAYPSDPSISYVVHEFDACGEGPRTGVRYCDEDEFGCYSIGLMVYGAIAADLSGMFTSPIAGPPRRCLPPGTPRIRSWRLRETTNNYTYGCGIVAEDGSITWNRCAGAPGGSCPAPFGASIFVDASFGCVGRDSGFGSPGATARNAGIDADCCPTAFAATFEQLSSAAMLYGLNSPGCVPEESVGSLCGIYGPFQDIGYALVLFVGECGHFVLEIAE